jgi:hypothetical protein
MKIAATDSWLQIKASRPQVRTTNIPARSRIIGAYLKFLTRFMLVSCRSFLVRPQVHEGRNSGTQPYPAQYCDQSRKAQYSASCHEPPPPSDGQTGRESNGTNRGKAESAKEKHPRPRPRGSAWRVERHWREDRPSQGEEGPCGAEREQQRDQEPPGRWPHFRAFEALESFDNSFMTGASNVELASTLR